MALNIINNPTETAEHWEEILENPSKKDFANIVSTLMGIGSIYAYTKNYSLKKFNEFFQTYRKVKSLKVKCEDYEEKWSLEDGIQFLRDVAHDVIKLDLDDRTRPLIESFVAHCGIFLWLQKGETFKDILKYGQKLVDSNDSNESNDEEDIDSINDELPYFGSTTSSGNKTRRKLVKRSNGTKTSNSKNDSLLNQKLANIKELLKKHIKIVKSSKTSLHEAELNVTSAFLFILKYVGFDYLKAYDQLQEYIKNLK